MDIVTGPASPDAGRLLDQPLRACLDSVVDSVAGWEAVRDGSGAIVDFLAVYANEAGAANIGVSVERLIGRRMCELFPHLRADGRFERYCAVVATGVPLVEGEIERLGRCWELRASRLGDGLLAIWRDITDRTRIERDLERARAAAERAGRANDEFLATVSHELRTPLYLPLRRLESSATAGERVSSGRG
jgi:signal transduction histidine kinase